MAHTSSYKTRRSATVLGACLAIWLLLTLAPAYAHAVTTVHTDGFGNIPAQYIVFDNLDLSKATLTANDSTISKATVQNIIDGDVNHASVVWNAKANGAHSLTNPFSIRFNNAGYDASDGSRVDLVLNCKSVETQKLFNQTIKDTRVCLMYTVVQNGTVDLSSIVLGNVAQKGYETVYAVRQTYDVRVYKTGTNTATSHPLLCYVTDIDTMDGSGTEYTWGGSFAEGVNLLSGYGSDTYLATNTTLGHNPMGTRFYGTAVDNNTEKSAVAFTINASGGTIAWTGGNAGCGTILFKAYAKQIKATSGANGSIKASGTNATIAAGKSLTEKVGWRTNKTYTITPATGYKISSITVDGASVSITNSAKQTYTFSNVKANHAISATYEPITYKVAFNGNGSTSGSTAAMTSLKWNTDYTLRANGFTRTGYYFSGWNTKADGSGTSYANKASIKNLSSTDGATITLYAQWAPYALTINYRANGATYDNLAQAPVQNDLLRTYTYNYDGRNLATYGVANANRGTWQLVKPGYHATAYWLVGSKTSSIRINADTPYPTIQDFAAACGVSIDGKNATVNLYAEYEKDPPVQRTVVVRIPEADYDSAIDSGYGTPSFAATHAGSGSPVNCLVDFASNTREGGYVIARNSVTAPAESTCTIANTTRFTLVDTQVDGLTTIFTMGLEHLGSQAYTASVVNHVNINDAPGSNRRARTEKPAEDVSDIPAAPTSTENEGDEHPADEPPETGNAETGAEDANDQPVEGEMQPGQNEGIDEETLQPSEPADDPEDDQSAQVDQESEPIADAKPLLAKGETVNASIPDEVEHIVFDSGQTPDGACSIDLSADESGSVVGYYLHEDRIFVIVGGLPGLPIVASEDCSGMFEGKTALRDVDTNNLDLSEARNLSRMFAGCTSLEQVDATRWDVRKADNLQDMFLSCESLQQIEFGPLWQWEAEDDHDPAFPVNMASQNATYDAGSRIPQGMGLYRLASKPAQESEQEEGIATQSNDDSFSVEGGSDTSKPDQETASFEEPDESSEKRVDDESSSAPFAVLDPQELQTSNDANDKVNVEELEAS